VRATIVPGEFRWVVRRPALLLKGPFSVLVAVPVIALVVARVAARNSEIVRFQVHESASWRIGTLDPRKRSIVVKEVALLSNLSTVVRGG
jgi:hypothetical protein